MSNEPRYFGAHVSAAGSVAMVPARAAALGANCAAFFVKNQRRWTERLFSDETIQQFNQECLKFDLDKTKFVVHSGYLINLGSPRQEVEAKSLRSLINELQLCQQLGLTRLVLHPGSHLNLISEAECLAQIARNLKTALAETESATILLENTAGQGTNLGYRFEQLADIMDKAASGERVKICLDTCHLWAAGYDFSQQAAASAVWQDFGRIIGWDNLGAVHFNDSKGGCGSRLDRHASLGSGSIPLPALASLAKDVRFNAVPFILETPDPTLWPKELNWLRQTVYKDMKDETKN